MTEIYLLATESDPIASAIESSIPEAAILHRISRRELKAIELTSESVVLLGSEEGSRISAEELPERGFIQFLGCRPSQVLLDHPGNAEATVSGISPVLATRVANRVIGFTGPLAVKPLPSWGVIGLGVVGSEVAKRATANRSPVVVTDMRTPRSGSLNELGVRRQTLDLLVAGSDVVTIHVHEGPTASPLISERELWLMSNESVLINTSASSVVDEPAVLAALRDGEIAGYATDCPGSDLESEDEELTSSGKLVVTTNPLTNQIGAPQQIAKYVLENVQAHADGNPIQGQFQPIDYPAAGDPSFWSSRMSPRQD